MSRSHTIRRTILGSLRDALQVAKAKHKKTMLGIDRPMQSRAAARVRVLREAYSAVDITHMVERQAHEHLRNVILGLDTLGLDHKSTQAALNEARAWLEMDARIGEE